MQVYFPFQVMSSTSAQSCKHTGVEIWTNENNIVSYMIASCLTVLHTLHKSIKNIDVDQLSSQPSITKTAPPLIHDKSLSVCIISTKKQMQELLSVTEASHISAFCFSFDNMVQKKKKKRRSETVKLLSVSVRMRRYIGIFFFVISGQIEKMFTVKWRDYLRIW